MLRKRDFLQERKSLTVAKLLFFSIAFKVKYVQNVPLERFEETFIRKPYKGRRSCSPPLEMLSHFSPLAPLFHGNKGISPSAEGDQRALPFGNPQAFEKA